MKVVKDLNADSIDPTPETDYIDSADRTAPSRKHTDLPCKI